MAINKGKWRGASHVWHLNPSRRLLKGQCIVVLCGELWVFCGSIIEFLLSFMSYVVCFSLDFEGISEFLL